MPKSNLIKLKCSTCDRINYYVYKSKGKSSEKKDKKLELKKFCKWCRGHTLHKESKK